MTSINTKGNTNTKERPKDGYKDLTKFFKPDLASRSSQRI